MLAACYAVLCYAPCIPHQLLHWLPVPAWCVRARGIIRQMWRIPEHSGDASQGEGRTRRTRRSLESLAVLLPWPMFGARLTCWRDMLRNGPGRSTNAENGSTSATNSLRVNPPKSEIMHVATSSNCQVSCRKSMERMHRSLCVPLQRSPRAWCWVPLTIAPTATRTLACHTRSICSTVIQGRQQSSSRCAHGCAGDRHTTVNFGPRRTQTATGRCRCSEVIRDALNIGPGR